MTQDQTTTDTTGEIRRAPVFSPDPEEEQRLRQETLRAAEVVSQGGEVGSVPVVVGNLLGMAGDAAEEIERLRAEKSAILTDTGRDFTRLFRALGFVQETDMGEAVEEVGRIYDERDRLRAELADLKARAVVLPVDWREQLREIHKHELTGGDRGVAISRAVSVIASWSAVPAGSDTTEASQP